MTWWGFFFSVLSCLYMIWFFQKVYNTIFPAPVPVGRIALTPLWGPEQKYRVACFLSTSSQFKSIYLDKLRKRNEIVFESEPLVYSHATVSRTVDLQLTEPNRSVNANNANANANSANLTVISSKVWVPIHANKSNVFLHVLLVDEDSLGTRKEVTKQMLESGAALYSVINLIKYDKIPRSFRQRYLLSDFDLVKMSPVEAERLKIPRDTIVSYWKPEVAVKLVTDFTNYTENSIPEPILKNIVYKERNTAEEIAHYKPALYADEIGLTTDKYVVLNSSVDLLPLKISFEPMELQRWLFMNQMEESLKQQSGMGFTDKDLDDVRRLISDTSVYLITVTFIASLLHLVFELLAFQSDISFWQNNKSLAGLSTRALITDLISQIIVFLFLVDSDTSLLVTVPSFIAIIIQIWKINKATGITIQFNSYFVPRLEFVRWKKEVESSGEDSQVSTKMDKLTAVTLEADRFATTYLSVLLFPVVVGFAVNSLVNEKHLSWYSWGIGALTSCVYTFGFILMCPQLYINHKLKSVSHLPWNYLVYKFLNTFIDDLFAFIIKMPTMHRLSVFRDDLVFFIYMYQRRIYQIDENRPYEK